MIQHRRGASGSSRRSLRSRLALLVDEPSSVRIPDETRQLTNECLDREKCGDHEQRDADRAAQAWLGKLPVSRAPSHAPGSAPARPAPSRSHSTSSRSACAANPATPRKKPTTRFVPTAGRARGRPPQQRRHPQRAEDDSERTADEADHEAEDGRRPEVRLRATGRARNGETSRSSPFQARTAAITAKSARRDEVTRQGADDGARDRGRRHPRDDAPVDPPCARMPIAAGRGGSRADRDVRPGRGAGSPAATSIAGRRSVPSTRPTAAPR